MEEVLYDHSSILIVLTLLACTLAAMELGVRRGRRKKAFKTEAITHANAVLASMLGLLALLLAFTFSAALQRFDDRSRTVVAEANVIGTAYLRALLLPAGMRDEVRVLLRQYLEVRIREGRIDFADAAEQDAQLAEAAGIEAQLWNLALEAAAKDSGLVTTGLFIQSLNELIDASTTRKAALDRHVPEAVLFLLFATVVLTTATLGYASGIAGHRVTLAAFILVMLIGVVVYLIIDLDRPRRGTIQVSQQTLLSLQKSIGSVPEFASKRDSAPAAQPPSRP